MSYLVYPGATHRRFEHSLGVMELAGQVFDALMDRRHLTDAVREALPGLDEQQKVDYYRQVVRLAGLLHDVGHLPFSHAAEEELLPKGRCHEHLTVDLILDEKLSGLLASMEPPVSPELVAKVAVGPKHWTGEPYAVWEALLSDTVTHDVFGADRMDYLLRDSLHAGVAYGRYDLHRLVQSLRILFPPSGDEQGEGPSSPTIGIVQRSGSTKAGCIQRKRCCSRVTSCSTRSTSTGSDACTTSISSTFSEHGYPTERIPIPWTIIW